MSLSVLESVIGNHSANVTMVTWSGAETWKFDTNHLILEGRLPEFLYQLADRISIITST